MIVRRASLKDAAAIAGVYVATWRVTYAAIVPYRHLTTLHAEHRAGFWRRVLEDSGPHPCLFVAATREEEVVGFVSGGAERSGDQEYRGEIYAIYVLPSHQGIGLGGRLLRSAAQALAGSGPGSLLVWIAEANPYRRFFEVRGGQRVRRRMIEVDGAALAEIAYGWRDTTVLIKTGMRGRRALS
jgi:GNAT superfamily N-acetyltransferase